MRLTKSGYLSRIPQPSKVRLRTSGHLNRISQLTSEVANAMRNKAASQICTRQKLILSVGCLLGYESEPARIQLDMISTRLIKEGLSSAAQPSEIDATVFESVHVAFMD